MATLAVTRRQDLTDAQWAALAPLLPVASSKGRPPKWEKRQLIDGIRLRIRIGAPHLVAFAAGAEAQQERQAGMPKIVKSDLWQVNRPLAGIGDPETGHAGGADNPRGCSARVPLRPAAGAQWSAGVARDRV